MGLWQRLFSSEKTGAHHAPSSTDESTTAQTNHSEEAESSLGEVIRATPAVKMPGFSQPPKTPTKPQGPRHAAAASAGSTRVNRSDIPEPTSEGAEDAKDARVLFDALARLAGMGLTPVHEVTLASIADRTAFRSQPLHYLLQQRSGARLLFGPGYFRNGAQPRTTVESLVDFAREVGETAGVPDAHAVAMLDAGSHRSGTISLRSRYSASDVGFTLDPHIGDPEAETRIATVYAPRDRRVLVLERSGGESPIYWVKKDARTGGLEGNLAES
ncbi:hypothetical protein [Corynebacterium tapiri]|uniref:Uncharacterized protein n=1 Tax=Corynebacterium tapiri TaxID=1448266 RepID=A0A5C4U4Z7_9CORY|nr:hypothetical protein [Corynebacterium tapiri]TNL98742.1 hypothetical protein FHE74_03735 [Corynebacterium tapiri]